MTFENVTSLLTPANSKIVLLVMDGLGGLPMTPGGKTELETANTPNMDRLAAEGCLGQTLPIDYGITPGSGPAHMSLFGYDPVKYEVGRGVLEALGVGMYVHRGDVAVRGNFCTDDGNGIITDRTRAFYAMYVDLDELKSEGDRMVGDDIAEDGIRYLQAINFKDREHKPVSIAAE